MSKVTRLGQGFEPTVLGSVRPTQDPTLPLLSPQQRSSAGGNWYHSSGSLLVLCLPGFILTQSPPPSAAQVPTCC